MEILQRIVPFSKKKVPLVRAKVPVLKWLMINKDLLEINQMSVLSLERLKECIVPNQISPRYNGSNLMGWQGHNWYRQLFF